MDEVLRNANPVSKALQVARAVNKGVAPASALRAAGIRLQDVTGTDLGDECMNVKDPKNDTIDLGWRDETHVQVRRLHERGKWMVEVMQRFNDDGTPA